jgi:NAD(P)-dependent dehydrogenase (short-subunit alcohol dehydrogenase family)
MIDKVGFDLTGKVALVTGAGRGLGAQISEDILRAGGSVMLAARKRPDELMGMLKTRKNGSRPSTRAWRHFRDWTCL